MSQMYVRQKHAALYGTQRQRACRFLIKESNNNGPNDDDVCGACNMEKEVLSILSTGSTEITTEGQV